MSFIHTLRAQRRGGHTPGMMAVRWSPELRLVGDNAFLAAQVQGPEDLPGHDPALLDWYPRVTDRIVRLA